MSSHCSPKFLFAGQMLMYRKNKSLFPIHLSTLFTCLLFLLCRHSLMQNPNTVHQKVLI